MMEPRTTSRVSLTALLGTPVTDSQGHLRGRLKDIAVGTGADAGKVIAFDTVPGNMVIDALAQELFGKPFDRNGAIAASGKVLERVLAGEMRNPYYKLKPPRTAGREQFGRTYAADFLAGCRRESKRP